jgi:hypothetical protein
MGASGSKIINNELIKNKKTDKSITLKSTNNESYKIKLSLNADLSKPGSKIIINIKNAKQGYTSEIGLGETNVNFDMIISGENNVPILFTDTTQINITLFLPSPVLIKNISVEKIKVPKTSKFGNNSSGDFNNFVILFFIVLLMLLIKII